MYQATFQRRSAAVLPDSVLVPEDSERVFFLVPEDSERDLLLLPSPGTAKGIPPYSPNLQFAIYLSP